MSLNLKPTPKLAFILAATVAAGLVLGGVSQMSLGASRAPASAAPPTKSALFKSAQLKMAKPNQMVDVQIDVVGGFPTTNDQEATLRATIQFEHPLDGNLDFQWRLPAGVQHVAGELKDSIPGLQPGQTVTREIVVLGFSSEGLPRNVTLDVSGKTSGSIVGNTSVIRSHPTRSDLSIGFRPSKAMLDESRMQNKSTSEEDPASSSRPELPKGLNL
ncbi:MAG: hypothetical protein ACK5P7_05755 [Bdellovibrio sp.]|jgi:hypothetical protein